MPRRLGYRRAILLVTRGHGGSGDHGRRMMMKTDTTVASSFDTPAPAGATLLTDDEIAAVGGGTLGLVILAATGLLAVGLCFSRMQ
jgi:hypothetical protein